MIQSEMLQTILALVEFDFNISFYLKNISSYLRNISSYLKNISFYLMNMILIDQGLII